MNFEHLIAKATQLSKQKIAIASAEDVEVLDAVAAALKIGLAEFLLYGNKIEIEGILKKKHPDLMDHPGISIFDEGTKEEAAAAAVKAVRDKHASVLMKGNLPTSIILKAILNKDFGLRSGKILSHVAVFEVPGYKRLLLLTDAAMNIAPRLEQKAEIIKNAVKIAESIGVEMPKVAPLAAVETITESMSATLDAASLTEMNRSGEIADCIVDGPFALDIAISEVAAEHKGIKSEVAGNADILLVPAIEVGNVLYKSLIYFANAKVGAVIAGATAPIVLTSRADTAESKLYSLALAVCTASK